ncbi:MAG: hypothetical protein M3Y55_00800 [Pseudomonadota bacterium]|nr:hypothetical protein [Pseudomonadota bacterium]MDQ2764298.1 hypothetical protein [Pseudomonadota bacterium]
MSAEHPTPAEYAQYIGESVAALAMLKDQICGMYAALEQKGRNQSDQVKALSDAQIALRQLLGQFPKDPITLSGLHQASARVEAAARALPGTVAGAFSEAVRPDIEKISDAATRTTQAAHEFVEQARSSYWKTALMGLFVSLVVAGVLVAAGLYWWIPARADVEAQSAEVARLTATIAQLKKQGGEAQIVQCETRLCVRTEETGKAPKVVDAKKGETYRVIKGY